MWWSVHLEGGPRRVNHAAVAVGDRIFSFGGYCTGDNYRDHRPIDVFVLNTATFRWKAIPKPEGNNDNEVISWPYQRYGHTVVSYNDKIYLFGGRNDGQPCNTVYCFDPCTLKWSQPHVRGEIPSPRDGHSACVINGAMYIFSGYEMMIPHFNPDVYKLDLKTFIWTLLKCSGTPPMPRDFHTATAIGDLMFIFGGRSDRNVGLGAQLLAPQSSNEYYSDRLTYLDTNTLTWGSPIISNQQPRPSGRRSHTAISLYGNLLLFGGFNGSTNEHKNDMWILDTSTWEWKQIQPHGTGPNPRRRMVLCRVGNQLFLFGGTSPYHGPRLYYTPEQLAVMPVQEHQMDAQLMDHNDLYVLDLSPSLRTLCLIKVIQNKEVFDVTKLPLDIQRDLECMTKEDNISKPLLTLPLG